MMKKEILRLVKVTFKPWEEVVIHESICYPLEDLIKLCSIGVQPGGLGAPLQWAEGVVFRFMAMPPPDDIVKEQLQGKVHWSVVEWALMSEYKNVVLIRDINAKIPIINVSSTTILCEVAKALKEHAGK
jgi:hypothetical protein